MDANDKTLMTPLDHLVSSQELQTLKLLIPYTPPANQKFLAVYVKFMELQRTMSVFQDFGKDIHTQGFDRETASPTDMINEILPYLPKDNSGTIENILNMMNMMEMFSTFQNMNPSGGDSFGGMNPMDMMQGMLTPEQQEMYSMYSTMFDNTPTSDDSSQGNSGNMEVDNDFNKKGNNNNGYEHMD